MASHFVPIILFSLLFSLAAAQPSFRPKSLVLPVKRDPSTLQYITHIRQRTPLVSVDLTLDLGGLHLWVDCDKGYVSSTYRTIHCRTSACTLAGADTCDTENTCGTFPDNTVINLGTYGNVSSDIVSVQSTNGKNPGQYVSVKDFIFVCAPTFLLQGLANGVKGMAGLGRVKTSLPSQFSAGFSLQRKFAICLTSGNVDATGVVFFGDGPYVFLPGFDASTSLTYTPLILNKVSTAGVYSAGEASSDYFIGVKSIRITEKKVPINTTLLSIDNEGYGGTKISTVNPYTVLETSIYKAVTEYFIDEMVNVRNVPRVASVAPFGACFDAKKIGVTRVGASVPWIDLVLQNESVYWRIFGANSMVYVSDDVACLGFVDGGVRPRTSIVIGGYQIEDNLLQFDLATSRLGFTSSLLFSRTTCANFNFTSNA